MQKILVISDTHNNQRLLRKACENENDASHIFHLGDNYSDLDNNYDLTHSKTILKVPGIFHPGYRNKSLPYFQIISVNLWNFLLVHDIGDLKNLTKINDIDVLLHGHTHHPEITTHENFTIFNPGHLKRNLDRGEVPTYGILSFDGEELTLKIKGLNNQIISSVNLVRDR